MPDLGGKRTLVTGAGGFIGANLVRALAGRGAEVHAIVRGATNLWRLAGIEPEIEIHLADLTDGARLTEVIKAARPEIIFNSAVFSGHPSNSEERVAALRDNVIGTANLLESLAAVEFSRLVHLGGSLEYGAKAEPMLESDLLEPTTFRGVTKAAATLLCRQFALSERRPVVILRPFSVFGYWEAHSRLVPTLMLALLKHNELRLTAGGIRRDFIFIEDVVEACLAAATTAGIEGEIINAGSGEQWSNEELAAAAQEVAGIEIKMTPDAFPRRPADTDHWVADVSKAKRLLGWAPRHTLREGLAKTFAWFREYEREYDHWLDQ